MFFYFIQDHVKILFFVANVTEKKFIPQTSLKTPRSVEASSSTKYKLNLKAVYHL